MEVEVKVNLNPVNALFRRLLGFNPVQAGALAGWQFLRDYHSKMDWKGDRYLAAGPNSGQFARDIVKGWQLPTIQGKNQATVVNTDPLLAWKITGGPIYAQQAQYLTIPVDYTAKGIPAREYHGLFRAGNALCIRLGREVQAIYALKPSVYQQPWPGAMPDDEDIQAAFVGKVRVELTETING
jgi:hypothetical protein